MKIPSFHFPIYGLIIILSIVVGMIYIVISLKREKNFNKNIYLFFLMYMFFALFFGKMFTIIASGMDIKFMEAGLSSYGGLIGVIVAAIVFEKIMPLKGKLIKYVILSLPLVYGISKLACFFAGCCYGIPYDGIFSVTYVDDLNIPLFPIQLLETIISLTIFFVCHQFKKINKMSYIVLVLVAIWKFIFEFFRYDHMNVLLNFNQGFSIILLVIIIIYYGYRRRVLK